MPKVNSRISIECFDQTNSGSESQNSDVFAKNSIDLINLKKQLVTEI